MSESRIISQCAPTLAGIKTGSLFPHPYDSKEQVYKDIREINRRLIPKGLCLIPLRFTEKNVLLYLYRPAWLRRDLSDETACEVLREMGYTRSDCGSCLAQLMRRMQQAGYADESCALRGAAHPPLPRERRVPARGGAVPQLPA